MYVLVLKYKAPDGLEFNRAIACEFAETAYEIAQDDSYIHTGHELVGYEVLDLEKAEDIL